MNCSPPGVFEVLNDTVVILLGSATAHAGTPTIVFESPRGGEVYGLGQAQKVRLGSKTRAKTVKIELSRDGGATFELLGTVDNTVKDKEQRNILSFTVSGTSSSNCVIKATGTVGKTTVSSLSSPFSIGSAGSPPPGSVTSGSLADGNVTTVKLADGSVTSIKLADGSVTNPKLAAGGGEYRQDDQRGGIGQHGADGGRPWRSLICNAFTFIFCNGQFGEQHHHSDQ